MKKQIILVFLFVILVLVGCSAQKNKQEKEMPIVQKTINDSEKQLTPEEVLAQMDDAEGVNLEQGPINVEIISPEEEKFLSSQARFYNARINGLVKGSSCSCDWKFYLNEYDEEVLYKTMDDQKCTGADLNEGLVCGFTSTFIEGRGDLRVQVNVQVKNYQGDKIQTATAERKYRVE